LQDDPEDYEKRDLAVKLERLKSAEILQNTSAGIVPAGWHLFLPTTHAQIIYTVAGNTQAQDGFIWSLIVKVISNVQLTVKNVHIRYEDKQSNPTVRTIQFLPFLQFNDVGRLQHPFAAGLTLPEFKMHSTDENWKPAFIQNIRNAIYKVCMLHPADEG
jgi:vacuolar protein sorting-associated protein 13A/C